MKHAPQHGKKLRSIKRSSHWRKLSIIKIPGSVKIMGFAVVVALLAASGIVYGAGVISDRMKPTDQQTSDDMYAIVQAVNTYGREHHDMPPNLEALSVTLHGNKGDYRYEAKPKDGGPTTTWTLCGTFRSATVDLDPEKLASGQTTLPTWNQDSPEVFTYHRKGEQCYRNNSYKSNSDWGLVYNDDEKPALKTTETNFEKLYADALEDHKAFMQVIGQPVESAPLGKYCVPIYGPRKQVVYNCYIKSYQTFSAMTDHNNAKVIMRGLKDAAASARTISSPKLDEKMIEMADGSGKRYNASLATAGNKCTLSVDFDGGQNRMTYYVLCGAPYSAQLPKGFTVTDKYDPY